MRRERRERLADLLIVLGAASLFLSLFLTWSHQFSAGFLAQYDHSTALQGVPHDSTAWQLYSLADVLLALLAGALLLGASVGGRALRTGLVVAAGIALAFVIHRQAGRPQIERQPPTPHRPGRRLGPWTSSRTGRS